VVQEERDAAVSNAEHGQKHVESQDERVWILATILHHYVPSERSERRAEAHLNQSGRPERDRPPGAQSDQRRQLTGTTFIRKNAGGPRGELVGTARHVTGEGGNA
jgi:hypothetical protein